MTKQLIFGLILSSLFSCKETPPTPGDPNNPPVYSKEDLKKLHWIEGNWKSEVAGPGFYQTYSFSSDTTLDVLSYQFDGKDSSGTNITKVYWSNNHIYMGTNKEWVATLLTDNQLYLSPVRSGWHTISWKYDSKKGEWTAEHKRPDFIRTIKMKAQAPLQELLKK
ncbi:MAG: hypothetical protein J0M29_15610 [Chitinophagales bacterium]|nr:hypothetical protein [Chitinophagales bacterium]